MNKKIGRTNNKTRRPAAARAGRRSLAETAQVRVRILDEAEHRFASKGYRGVSFRELGRAVGVRPYTIQHHFGSKLGLYSAVLCRWDGEVRGLVAGTLGAVSPADPKALIERVVDEVFEFFLARRDWVILSARAALGEGLPPGAELEDRSWVRFLGEVTRTGAIASAGFDLRLLLITVEGILNNLVLSDARYRQLFGRDLDDPRLRAQVKSHLKLVLLRLWLPGESARTAATSPNPRPRPRRAR